MIRGCGSNHSATNPKTRTEASILRGAGGDSGVLLEVENFTKKILRKGGATQIIKHQSFEQLQLGCVLCQILDIEDGPIG
jgi:hypothetical protein